MLLSQIQPIEEIVYKLSDDYRVFNDYLGRVVIQFETDHHNFTNIKEQIRCLLPAGTSITCVYQADSYEITFIEGGEL